MPKAQQDTDKAATPANTREREDGFWEVSGVAGYFNEETAKRVAQQVGDAQAKDGFRPSPGAEEF